MHAFSPDRMMTCDLAMPYRVSVIPVGLAVTLAREEMHARIRSCGRLRMSRLVMRTARILSRSPERAQLVRGSDRRPRRASCVFDFLVFAALLIGCSLYDRPTSKIVRSGRTDDVHVKVVPVISPSASREYRKD